MAPLYKKALIVGATSGIGKDLARKLVEEGTKVIVVGRRRERLDDFVSSVGSDKASAFTFDITSLPDIPSFASQVTSQNPDLDCVILNSGIQRPYDFSKPETVDLNMVDEELKTNYTSYVHMSMAFLPFLQKQAGKKTHFLYMSATLGLVPGMLRTGNYNASKGALHNWILVFREQLKMRERNNVQVVEIFPPAVQTELHDERHQPDLKDGHAIGMPLVAFTEALYVGMSKGEEQIGIGNGKATLEGFEKDRQKAFHDQVKMVNEILTKHVK